MPNWCENDLFVRTDWDEEDKRKIAKQKKEIKRFVKFAKTKKSVLDTEQFIPYPKKYRELDDRRKVLEAKHLAKCKRAKLDDMSDKDADAWRKKNPNIAWETSDGFNSGGYEWCLKNWGTKWGICEAELLDDNGDELEYFFTSAWCPPDLVIKKMSKMFPTLIFTLTYFEGGCEFNGIYKCQKGEVIDDRCGKYFGSRGG